MQLSRSAILANNNYHQHRSLSEQEVQLRPTKMRRLREKEGCCSSTIASTSTSFSTNNHECNDRRLEESANCVSFEQPESKREDRKSSISFQDVQAKEKEKGNQTDQGSQQKDSSPNHVLRSTNTSNDHDTKSNMSNTITNNNNMTSTPKSNHDELLSSLDPNLNTHESTSPDIYVQKLFQTILNFTPLVRPTLKISHQYAKGSDYPFIPPITEEEQAAYNIEIVNAVRENDMAAIKSYHYNGGRSLSCCNRFGESLLHMACRRGFESIVLYLIQDASVSVRITDDCGRTPLHDALWHKECQYNIMDLLVRTDPVLLFTCDKHGHTPFAYARREHWGNWRQFLWDRREHMKHAMDKNELELFRNSDDNVLS
jgi:hypothetical protein